MARFTDVHPWHVLAALVGVVVAVAAAGPLTDVDVYWHVLAGHDIVRAHDPAAAGAGWSIAPVRPHWTSSEWLAEVVMYAATAFGGWRALLVLRLVLALAALGMLAAVVLRGRRTAWPAAAFPAVALAVLPALQERPQLASLVFLCWLAPVLDRARRGGPAPHPAVVFGTTALWANLHGYSVLVPLGWLLVALARWLDARSLDAGPRRSWTVTVPRPALLRAVVATAAGMLTPQGPAGLLNPLRFAAAGGHIAEWQPTTLRHPATLGLLAVLTAVVLRWARSGATVPPGEPVTVLALAGFAALAQRNVAPAAVLLAPLAAAVLDRGPAREPAGRRERRALAAAVATVLAVGAGLAAARTATVRPVPRSEPSAIAAALAADGRVHRVVNSYDVAGYLLWAGGPRVRVAIDGRADHYGAAYADRYLGMLATSGDWEPLLHRLRPTDAVLLADTPLAAELRRRHWRTVRTDAGYVLLRRP